MKKIKLLNRKVKADYKKIIQALTKGGISIASGNPARALKEAIDLINAFELKPEPESLAYELTLIALTNAAHNLVLEYEGDIVTAFDVPEHLLDHPDYIQFLEGITAVVEETAIELDANFIDNPRAIPIVPAFQTYLKQWFTFFLDKNRWHLDELETITARFPTYFVFAFHTEWQENIAKYEPLAKHIQVVTNPAQQRERQWLTYNAFLQTEVERSIFGDSFGLKKIFIEPRAYYEQKPKPAGRRQIATDEQAKKKRIVFPLKEHLYQWLNTNFTNRQDDQNIKILSGGPGSGKSSFAKMWAAEIVQATDWRVLFIPLHRFDINDSVPKALLEYIRQSAELPISFESTEAFKKIPKLLLIFDGLDELSKQGSSTIRDSAREFVNELRSWCSRNTNLKILIAGRPISVQNAEVKLRGEADQIVNMIPYFVKKVERRNYEDKQNLLATDQRTLWWNRYAALKGLPIRNMPEVLQNNNLQSLTPEPLLNYLIALAWQQDTDQFTTDTNMNQVYKSLIKGVYDRNYEKKHQSLQSYSPITFDKFMEILEEIAICAWQGGEVRITTVEKIEKHLYESNLGQLLEEYKKTVKGGVSRLLTAFYFRKFGQSNLSNPAEETFEFTHKSFGEYLTAKALVEHLHHEIHTKREQSKKIVGRSGDKGITIEQALSHWLFITGDAPLTSDIQVFIKREIEARKEELPLAAMQQTLAELISHSIIHGIPAPMDRLVPKKEYQKMRNADETLLALHSTIAYTTNQVTRLQWEDAKKSPGEYFNHLSTHINAHNNDLFRKCLNHINLSGADLSSADLRGADLSNADLSSAVLSKADLSSAVLRNAVLRKADLSSADLRNAVLRSAVLSNAVLSNADLRSADLRNAVLRSAVLSNADLSSAVLRYANLSSAVLSSAVLSSAVLSSANLSSANLNYADLRKADLSDADLSDANLSDADLSDADLSDADLSSTKNLTPQQLNEAQTLHQAKLPDYIKLENISPHLRQPPKQE